MTNAQTERRTNSSARRREEEQVQDQKRARESRQNKGFTQVYDNGWNRLNRLIEHAPEAARLYLAIAQHMDTAGALVATQDALAGLLNVSVRTIQRQSKTLEDQSALVRIPLQGRVYAYCLNPEEVWKAYDSGKEYAAFYTKTLVNTKSIDAETIKKRLTLMMQERRAEK